jgi:DNA modification methylase
MGNVRATAPAVKGEAPRLGPLRRGAVVHGDALLVLPEVPAESFDVVFLDWPYATASAVRGKDDGAAGRIYGPVSFLTRVCSALRRVARTGCHAYVFSNHQGLPDHALAVGGGALLPEHHAVAVQWRVAVAAGETVLGLDAWVVERPLVHGREMSLGGWYPSTTIAWGSRYVGTGGVWRGAWTPILVASKGPMDRRVDGAFANFIDDVPALRHDRAHPYEKPAALWDRLCAPSVVRGTRVLDLFAGSASSRPVVEALGGEWYGLDVDVAYAEAKR